MSEAHTEETELSTAPKDIQDFSALVEAIGDYNDQFSLGRMISRVLVQQVNIAEKASLLEDEGLPADEAYQTAEWLEDKEESLSQEQQIARAVLGISSADILESAGLGLSPVRKEFTMMGPVSVEEIGRVQISLVDGGNFVGLLQRIDKDAADDKFKDSVRKIVGQITSEAYQTIAEGGDEAVIAELLTYADAISQGMDYLGIERNYLLDNLSKYAKQGLVREFVDANQSGVLQGVGSGTFCPSEWQRDSNPAFMRRKWAQVLEAIARSKANPKGGELAEELIQKASAHLSFAKKDWKSLQQRRDGKSYNYNYGEEFDTIFAEVDTKLMTLSKSK